MDNAMLNILKGFDNVEKKTLQESAIAECPPMGMDNGMGAQGGEISIKLDDTAQMAKVLMALQAITSGSVNNVQDAPMMPAPEESIEEDADPKVASMIAKFVDEMDTDMMYYGEPDVAKVGALIKQGNIEDAAGEMADAMADQDGGSDKFDMIMQRAQEYIEDYMGDMDEAYANEPEEEYMDTPDMLPSGDDLHRQKDMKAIRVKDPAVETASIKDRLWAALNEKKSTCSECGKPSYTTLPEEKQKGVDGKVCWKGYKRMGTKMKGGKRVDNCVKM